MSRLQTRTPPRMTRTGIRTRKVRRPNASAKAAKNSRRDVAGVHARQMIGPRPDLRQKAAFEVGDQPASEQQVALAVDDIRPNRRDGHAAASGLVLHELLGRPFAPSVEV